MRALGKLWDFSVIRDVYEKFTETDGHCSEDVTRMLQGLNNSEFWSFKMLDSSTKIQNGLLTGNFIDLGSYDECLDVTSGDGIIHGEHCMATIGLPNFPSQEENALEVTPTLTWSYCIPSSCSSNELQSVLSDLLGNVTVAQEDCHVTETTDLSGVDIFAMSFFAFFVIISVGSTLYDLMSSSKNKSELLRTFSLYSNGKKLFSTLSATDSMHVLNSIRFLSILWIILGHRYFFATRSPLLNLIDVSKLMSSVDFQLIPGATVAVDTFFLLSGLLNAYHLLKVLDASGRFPVAKYYVHRYVRTTPALAAVVFMYATLYLKLGSGPIWDRTAGPNKQLCVDNWWPTLLYINNYYNPVEQCAGQSWYLAVDMQLYWVSPLVILPCWKWPKIQKPLLGFLLLLSTAAKFAVAYVEKMRMEFTITLDLEEYRRVTQEMYVPTHMRASPYIIGIMLGFFLYDSRKNKRTLSLSKVQVMIGWLLSTGFCLSVILGNYPFMQTETQHPYNRFESSFYISLHGVAWACGVSWVIIACMFGFGGVINEFLSWKLFTPLSRLTYCMFLTHLAVQNYQLGTVRTNDYLSTFSQVHKFFGDVMFTLLTSSLLCLLFESPIMGIEKFLLKPRVSTKKSTGETNDGYVDDGKKNESRDYHVKL